MVLRVSIIPKKGQLGAGIIITIIVTVALIGSLLYFFFVFKFRTKSQAHDEYTWNKIQEIPLSLFSMDIEKKSFVSIVNKVYYFPDDAESSLYLYYDVPNFVNQQLFYLIGGKPSNLGYIISVDTGTETAPLTFSQTPTTETYCRCLPAEAPPFEPLLYFECNEDCLSGHDKPCGKEYPWGRGPAPELCFDAEVIPYSASYPLPLAFSGTDDFITTISYNALEYEEMI